jgi:hypothetical protein
MAVSEERSGPCASPGLFHETVLPVEHAVPGLVNGSVLQFARAGPGGKWSVGPLAVRWTDLAGTHLEATYGRSYLWVYVPLAPSGGEVLAVSETTGQVSSRAAAPQLASPLLYAGAGGLWLAARGSLGPAVAPGLYFVAPNGAAPKLVVRAERPTWLAGSGRVVWLGTSSRGRPYIVRVTPGGAGSQMASRPVPSRPLPLRPVSPFGADSPGPQLPVNGASYAAGASGLIWGLTGAACQHNLLAVNPATGTFRPVMSLPALRNCRAEKGAPVLAVYDQHLWVLERPGGSFSYLYRVKL